MVRIHTVHARSPWPRACSVRRTSAAVLAITVDASAYLPNLPIEIRPVRTDTYNNIVNGSSIQTENTTLSDGCRIPPILPFSSPSLPRVNSICRYRIFTCEIKYRVIPVPRRFVRQKNYKAGVFLFYPVKLICSSCT